MKVHQKSRLPLKKTQRSLHVQILNRFPSTWGHERCGQRWRNKSWETRAHMNLPLSYWVSPALDLTLLQRPYMRFDISLLSEPVWAQDSQWLTVKVMWKQPFRSHLLRHTHYSLAWATLTSAFPNTCSSCCIRLHQRQCFTLTFCPRVSPRLPPFSPELTSKCELFKANHPDCPTQGPPMLPPQRSGLPELSFAFFWEVTLPDYSPTGSCHFMLLRIMALFLPRQFPYLECLEIQGMLDKCLLNRWINWTANICPL